MKNILFVFILLFNARIAAQNSQVNWSSFSTGFGNSTSVNLSVRSITGQPLFGNGSNSTTNIGSGFFYNPNTTGIITTVEEYKNNIPSIYKLQQNYPNPFNPSTKINWQLPISSFVSLKVYDVLGNEVVILVNEEKPAGTYEVTWNATNLPSGVYFYRLQVYPANSGTENFVDTKKTLLLK